jgi:murein DD-endopeptidase MepM/ murein hydrolase activator NlpD
VQGYRLTSRFGDSGSYWSSGSHTGLDFAAAVGSPIRSVASGVVVSTAYEGAYGIKTVVRLADGTEVWYCHQDTRSVGQGQQVRGGQVIGTVGATGNVTGPHLHLEVRPGGGDPVDPEVSLHRHRVEA